MTHKEATGFIVVCDFCKDVLVSIGVDSGKIKIIPPSYSANKNAKSISHSRTSGAKILSVGRIVERKGFHFLIDSVKLLRNIIPDINLTIVGDGPFRFFLEEKIKKDNLSDIVSLTGTIDNKKLSQLYSESDLFVLAHTMLDNGDTEGAPMVFAEASVFLINSSSAIE